MFFLLRGNNSIASRLRRLGGLFLRDRRANMAAMVALAIIPLVGIMGLATEGSSWFLIQRGAQNAADAAVLAAATNGSGNPSGTTYITEGRAVTASYGFTNAANNATVTIANSDNTIPATCNRACYKVTVSKNVPVYLAQIVGYSGTNDSGFQTVTATAVAVVHQIPVGNCITAMGTGSNSYTVNGGGSINLNGCDVQVNGDAKCNGANADGGATYFFVAGANTNCDPAAPNSPSPTIADPYTSAYPSSNIPSNGCSSPTSPQSYWQEGNNYGKDNKNKTITLSPNTQPAKNNLSGTVALSPTAYCGDVRLSGNTTLTGSGTMVIENGMLDLNGFKLSGTGITIIFTGPTVGNQFNPSHTPPTGGTLDISAPTSGTWSGVAIYQDPGLTSGVDWTSSGNSLTWDVTGLIYMTKSNLTFSGTINKSSSGLDCFALITKTVSLSGNVTIGENQSQCAAAGLSILPNSNIPRAVLVQ
jgi:Flp pilus assembly protein TadG